MCIHLFNPPAPGCQPETSAGPGTFWFQGRCGECRCLSKYWQLGVTVPTGPVDFTPWTGHFVLTRKLAIDQPSARCVWLAPMVDLDPYLGLGGTRYGSPWQLIFDYFPDPFSAGLDWWIGKWTLHAGGFADYVDELESVLPGSNLLPPDAANYNGLSAYLHEGWDLNEPFRCLHPNRFTQIDTVYSAFPALVTVRPYWP